MTARRMLRLTASGILVLGVFLALERPWYQRWGASDEEVTRALPGDELVPQPVSQETRAITIAAPVEHVWPWLAQLGQDRGGFYSYDLLENLVGCRMPTEDRLRPDRQQWQLGQKLWMYPPEKAGGAGFATLRTLVPGRVLGFAGRAFGTSLAAPENGSWVMVLEPVSAQETRLLIRGRAAAGRSVAGKAFDRLLFEPAHFVMERRMMLGIKALAEGDSRGRVANHLQVGLWTLTFLVIVGSLVLRSAALLIAGGAAFQLLTLGQPPLLAAFLIVLGLSLLVRWTTRRQAPPALGVS